MMIIVYRPMSPYPQLYYPKMPIRYTPIRTCITVMRIFNKNILFNYNLCNFLWLTTSVRTQVL